MKTKLINLTGYVLAWLYMSMFEIVNIIQKLNDCFKKLIKYENN